MVRILRRSGLLADGALMLFMYPAALLLKLVRRIGLQNMPLCKNVLLRVGVFPVRNHYYEPQFDFRGMGSELARERRLPGVDLDVEGQLRQLEAMNYSAELRGIERGLPEAPVDDLEFRFGNVTFESGDAEYWYQLLRVVKPRRVFEIGSGHSTLMARRALDRNRADDPTYSCKHLCVEPYEMPWLEQAGVSVVRQRVEHLDPAMFGELEAGDVLFIDSSHVIRPQGDVVFEYLELLPTLRPGVIVHAHDIFTPRDYLQEWVVDRVRLWNEQYLLEAFLSHNRDWRVIGALNYLKHNHYDRLQAVAPYLTRDREPCSFYLQRVST
jgi:predicted O-methyltransferase YrrM